MGHRFLLATAVCASALGTLASCKRAPAPSPTAKPGASAAAAPKLVAAPSAEHRASATPSAVPSAKTRPQDVAQRLLMQWNAALDQHSVEALSSLYAPKVQFYGQPRTAAQVLEAKRLAFEKQPDFRQLVSGASFRRQDDGFRVNFKKLSGAALRHEAAGVLVVKPLDDKWQIVEESDDQTDARFKPRAGSCREAALNIAASEPAIIADMERVRREYPEATPGGIQNDVEEHADRYSGSQGYFLPDRYDPRWWIDAGSGDITVRDAYTTELLPVTPAQRALVRKLCSGKLESDEEGAADPP